MWVFHKFTMAFPHVTTKNHPSHLQPSRIRGRFAQSWSWLHEFCFFLILKTIRGWESQPSIFSKRFFKKSMAVSMNSETDTWQLLVDLIQIRENKGYNSKIRYVTVVWGAIRWILHINYNYIKFQSVNLQSRTGSRPTSGTTYICRASKSPPPGSQKPLLSLCNSTRTWRSSILDLSQPSKRQVDGGCGKKNEGIWSIIRNISTSRRLVNITKQFRKLWTAHA